MKQKRYDRYLNEARETVARMNGFVDYMHACYPSERNKIEGQITKMVADLISTNFALYYCDKIREGLNHPFGEPFPYHVSDLYQEFINEEY